MSDTFAEISIQINQGCQKHNSHQKNIYSGYMAPEYAMRGTFSVKSDVYSFGVLTLEIVSGVKISSTNQIMNFENLIVYVSIS